MAVSISATGLKGEAAMKIHGEVLFRVQGLGLCKGLLQKISITGCSLGTSERSTGFSGSEFPESFLALFSLQAWQAYPTDTIDMGNRLRGCWGKFILIFLFCLVTVVTTV